MVFRFEKWKLELITVVVILITCNYIEIRISTQRFIIYDSQLYNVMGSRSINRLNKRLEIALADRAQLQYLVTVNNDTAFVAVRRRCIHCNTMLQL